MLLFCELLFQRVAAPRILLPRRGFLEPLDPIKLLGDLVEVEARGGELRFGLLLSFGLALLLKLQGGVTPHAFPVVMFDAKLPRPLVERVLIGHLMPPFLLRGEECRSSRLPMRDL